MPNPNGPQAPAKYRHFFLDWTTKSFWPFDLQESHEPRVVYFYRQTDPDKSGVLLGCRDGYVRRYRTAWETDEGYEIESWFSIGPFRLGGSEWAEGILHQIIITSSPQSGSVGWWVYTADTCEETEYAYPKVKGMVTAGRSLTLYPRVRGGACLVKIGNGEADRRWAIESVVLRVKPLRRQKEF